MADLATTNFTVDETWYEGDKTGKERVLCKRVDITTGTAGGTSNQIPASVFGMSEIYEVSQRGQSNADAGNYLFMPDYAGENIIAINLEQSTDANRGDPADVAFATFQTKLIIRGKEAN
jgi:hypothetical protein